MNKTKAGHLKRQLADELRRMANLLENEQIVKDAGELKRAADNCNVKQKNSKYIWWYEVSNFEIGPIDLKSNRIKHSRPRTLQQITINLDVQVISTCLEAGAWENPFEDLAVNIEVLGETSDDQLLTCAWHLDKQPNGDPEGDDENYNEEDDKESNTFAHPIYHFHYGGKKVWPKEDQQFGTHLLLESPRLAHPPLDAILAIDFVLSNYVALEWRRLRRESSIYNDLIATAQERYWRPYAIAAASHWPNYALPKEWASNLVWPQVAP